MILNRSVVIGILVTLSGSSAYEDSKYSTPNPLPLTSLDTPAIQTDPSTDSSQDQNFPTNTDLKNATDKFHDGIEHSNSFSPNLRTSSVANKENARQQDTLLNSVSPSNIEDVHDSKVLLNNLKANPNMELNRNRYFNNNYLGYSPNSNRSPVERYSHGIPFQKTDHENRNKGFKTFTPLHTRHKNFPFDNRDLEYIPPNANTITWEKYQQDHKNSVETIPSHQSRSLGLSRDSPYDSRNLRYVPSNSYTNPSDRHEHDDRNGPQSEVIYPNTNDLDTLGSMPKDKNYFGLTSSYSHPEPMEEMGSQYIPEPDKEEFPLQTRSLGSTVLGFNRKKCRNPCSTFVKKTGQVRSNIRRTSSRKQMLSSTFHKVSHTHHSSFSTHNTHNGITRLTHSFSNNYERQPPHQSQQAVFF